MVRFTQKKYPHKLRRVPFSLTGTKVVGDRKLDTCTLGAHSKCPEVCYNTAVKCGKGIQASQLVGSSVIVVSS